MTQDKNDLIRQKRHNKTKQDENNKICDKKKNTLKDTSSQQLCSKMKNNKTRHKTEKTVRRKQRKTQIT